MTIRVLVNGAAGKMGRAMSAGILAEEDLLLVAAVDTQCIGEDIGTLSVCQENNVRVSDDLAATIQLTKPDVMLDFTNPRVVMNNLRIALNLGLSCVVGTSGLTADELAEADTLATEHAAAVFVAPNFALSAVLMMRFAVEAVKYFPNYEIIEIHNDKKMDAPSGTAVYTAQLMSKNRPVQAQGALHSFETIAGCRGGDFEGARIHSVRLPGVVAQQEVIFAGDGQLLHIKQESSDRSGFFPGVVLALRKIHGLSGLVVGLDKLL